MGSILENGSQGGLMGSTHHQEAIAMMYGMIAYQYPTFGESGIDVVFDHEGKWANVRNIRNVGEVSGRLSERAGNGQDLVGDYRHGGEGRSAAKPKRRVDATRL